MTIALVINTLEVIKTLSDDEPYLLDLADEFYNVLKVQNHTK